MSERLAIRTEGLGKCYGATWALRDCTLEIPAGSVTALVGPNGAGKTTLLHLVIGLTKQTAGTVEVLGLSPREAADTLLPKLGFVAQDHPLYRGLSIADTFKLGRHLNPHWNDDAAAARAEGLGYRLWRRPSLTSCSTKFTTPDSGAERMKALYLRSGPLMGGIEEGRATSPTHSVMYLVACISLMGILPRPDQDTCQKEPLPTSELISL